MSDGLIVTFVMLVYGFAMYLVGHSHGREDNEVKARVYETSDTDPRNNWEPYDGAGHIPTEERSDKVAKPSELPDGLGDPEGTRFE